jgi:CRP-like cAMP-binding protein
VKPVSETHLKGQLREVLKGWVELSERQWGTLADLFRVRAFGAQEHLLYPGSRDFELLFVCEGLLRFYYLAEDGQESNKAFVGENALAGPLAASALNLPVIYGVETLEPTTLLAADFAAFVALYDEHPVFDRLGRKLAELLLTRKELRTRSLLQQSAKERFLEFRAHHPELLKRVPQYHIASYLGVTEVSLSRLKRELVGRHYA